MQGRGWDVGCGDKVAGGEVCVCVCSPPVLTNPEAPSLKVLWQTCQVVSGSPALDSALQGHARPCLTQAQ